MKLPIVATDEFALRAMPAEEVKEILGMNLSRGMKVTDLPTIKIPGSAGKQWELPEGDYVKELEGVVIAFQTTRQYWASGLDEGDKGPPDCASDDSVTGVASKESGLPGGECKSCPFNQWGSASKGDGKACQERVLLYVLLRDDILPSIVSLPPTSLKGWDQYMMTLTRKATPFWAAVTKIGLNQDESAGGVEFSYATFEAVGQVAREERGVFQEAKQLFAGGLSVVRQLDAPPEQKQLEMDTPPKVVGEEPVEEDPAGDVPF